MACPRKASRYRNSKPEVDAVIAQLIDKGVTPDELERAKTRLIADATFARTTR